MKAVTVNFDGKRFQELVDVNCNLGLHLLHHVTARLEQTHRH